MDLSNVNITDTRTAISVVNFGQGRQVRPEPKYASVGDILIQTSMPFRFAMVKALDSIGLNTNGMQFKTILVNFYNYFVEKGNDINVYEFINSVAFRIKHTKDPQDELQSSKNLLAIENVRSVNRLVIQTFIDARNKYEQCLKFGRQPELILDEFTLMFAKAERKVYNDLLRFEKQSNFEDLFNGGGWKQLAIFVGVILLITKFFD